MQIQTVFIQYLPHALAGGFPQFSVHDTHASRGGIAICTIALPLHTLVPQLGYLTRHVLEPVYSSICQYRSLYQQYIQVYAGMIAPAHALENLWGVQDRVHLLGAPHGPYGIFSVTHLERKHSHQGYEQGFSHVSQTGHDIIVRLWRPGQVIPVQPIVDGHDHVRKRIGNAGASSCKVLGCRLVCQAIQHIREKLHELLNIVSINDWTAFVPFC